MGAHPFGETARKYMDSIKGIYAEETWKARDRRYRRLNNDVVRLKQEKRISTMSPKSMNYEDVRVILLDHKERVSNTDMPITHRLLRMLLEYCENDAYRKCLKEYPGLKPVRKNVRLKHMEDEVFDLILQKSDEVRDDDYRMLRAYTLVLMCICTGTRNKEIRFADAKDINTVSWRFDIIHIKGCETYGMPRTVPIPPMIRPLITRYLKARSDWLAAHDIQSKALFVSQHPTNRGQHVSSNTIRKMKVMVEEDIGVSFDLRECRRTFGQRYLDRDVDIETVSVLMGHSSTKTTEMFYGRRKNVKAIEKVESMWE